MAFLRAVLDSIEPLAKTLAKTHQVSTAVFDPKHSILVQAGPTSILFLPGCAATLWQLAENRSTANFDCLIDGNYIAGIKIYNDEKVPIMLMCVARTSGSPLTDELQNELVENLARTMQSCLQWSAAQRSTVVELMEKYEELTLLYDISERLDCLPSFDEVAGEILKGAIERVKCKAGRLVLTEEDGSYHERIFSNQGIPQTALTYKNDQDTAALCLKKPITQIINDSTNGHAEIGLTQLHVPVCLKDHPIGVLSLFRLSNAPFKFSEKKIAEMLTRQTAGKLESSLLYAKLESLFMDSIKMLVECIDARDSYTCGHSSRVSHYSVFLGRAIGLTEDQVKLVEIGALLHDVGKIRIRDNVLNKPAWLTEDERAVIQKHPEFGMRIVEHVKRLHNTVPCIYCHHEYYDGNGYPRRLAGEDIPLMGRIVSIADTFDAMTTTRPYRCALSQKAAYDELIRCRGTQFDPELAEIFAEAILRGEFSHKGETSHNLAPYHTEVNR